MTPQTRGLIALIATGVMWGVFPLYFNLLRDVPPVELLAHRVLWTAIGYGLLLVVTRRGAGILALLRGPEAGRLVAAAALIAVNWGVFIWAVNSGHAIDGSLGYYIFPLVAVLFGVLFRGERPGPASWLAIALAALGVVVLTWGLGVPPWIALALAVSFGLYGLIKTGIRAPAEISVAAEALILSPLALGWLVTVWATGWQGGLHFGRDGVQSLMMLAMGVITGLPLILFSYGSQRLRLSTVGMVLYLNPTLQAVLAVAVLGESLSPWHLAAFVLIWAGLAVYSAALIAAERRVSSVATSGTVVVKSSIEASAKPSPTT